MIEETPAPAVDRGRWRRWWLLAFAMLLVITAGFALGRGVGDEQPASSALPSSPVPESPSPSTEKATDERAEKATENGAGKATEETTEKAAGLSPTLLRLPGSPPTKGSGSFTYATKRGPVRGTKGPLKRYRVAVERGSNEDPAEFADAVEATLGDPLSWSGGGRLRLQMVGGADAADFTVYLATRETAGVMCLRGGTNIRVGGRPYTSCRTTGKAIINLDRWWGSATPFVTSRTPLLTYRRYVVNHEVGHELGHRHEGCPKAGGPAPVMVQQTLTVRGCKPYAWPRLGNRFLTGPSR